MAQLHSALARSCALTKRAAALTAGLLLTVTTIGVALPAGVANAQASNGGTLACSATFPASMTGGTKFTVPTTVSYTNSKAKAKSEGGQYSLVFMRRVGGDIQAAKVSQSVAVPAITAGKTYSKTFSYSIKTKIDMPVDMFVVLKKKSNGAIYPCSGGLATFTYGEGAVPISQFSDIAKAKKIVSLNGTYASYVMASTAKNTGAVACAAKFPKNYNYNEPLSVPIAIKYTPNGKRSSLDAGEYRVILEQRFNTPNRLYAPVSDTPLPAIPSGITKQTATFPSQAGTSQKVVEYTVFLKSNNDTTYVSCANGTVKYNLSTTKANPEVTKNIVSTTKPMSDADVKKVDSISASGGGSAGVN